MFRKTEHHTAAQIDKLLKKALPNGKKDFFGSKKRAFRKIMEVLGGPHDPSFGGEQFTTGNKKENLEDLKIIEEIIKNTLKGE